MALALPQGVTDLCDRTEIREVLLIVFIGQTIAPTDAVELRLRFLLDVRATWNMCREPLLNRRGLDGNKDD